MKQFKSQVESQNSQENLEHQIADLGTENLNLKSEIQKLQGLLLNSKEQTMQLEHRLAESKQNLKTAEESLDESGGSDVYRRRRSTIQLSSR